MTYGMKEKKQAAALFVDLIEVIHALQSSGSDTAGLRELQERCIRILNEEPELTPKIKLVAESEEA